MPWINRLRQGLQLSRSGITEPIKQLLSQGRTLSQAELDRLEEILIGSDITPRTAVELVQEVADHLKVKGNFNADILERLRQGVRERISGCQRSLSVREDNEPTVMLIAGVNGSGKTTTVAKIATLLRTQKPDITITIAAADTFRAAAIEQLALWAKLVNADLVKHRIGADPSAVVFDAIEHAQSTGGVVLIDTAGRLQTKHNLMEQLTKMERTVGKKLGRSSDERLLVMDVTTGQNGISQAEKFDKAIDLTGIILAKVDGTAKGGTILTVWEKLEVPIMYVGVGEDKDDLQEFIPDQFVDALLTT